MDKVKTVSVRRKDSSMWIETFRPDNLESFNLENYGIRVTTQFSTIDYDQIAIILLSMRAHAGPDNLDSVVKTYYGFAVVPTKNCQLYEDFVPFIHPIPPSDVIFSPFISSKIIYQITSSLLDRFVKDLDKSSKQDELDKTVIDLAAI
ncbi:hypothetical protein ACTXT7_006999 [Hymenolepis weldensis]